MWCYSGNGGWHPCMLGAIQRNEFDLQDFRVINVQGGNFTNDQLKAISQVKFTRLQSFNIKYTRVTGPGLAHMLNTTTYINIIYLNLTGIKMGLIGAKIIIKANLPTLQRLWIDEEALGNQGVRHLSKSHWPNLNQLIIRENHIQFDGYVELCNGNWLKLRHLLLTSNQVIIPGVMHLMTMKSKDFKKLFDKLKHPHEQQKIHILTKIFRKKYDKKNILN